MLKQMIIVASVLGVGLIGIFSYGYWSATRLPDNSPDAFLEASRQPAGKIVVTIGDSITHGRVSYNYVDELAKMPEFQSFTFINAGINSELAYNVLQRLDKVVRCQPDYITLLIGTNDLSGTLNEKSGQRYVKQWNLPQMPDIQWYEKNYRAIIDYLQKETHAKIAVLSLPPVTEDPNHPGFQKSKTYSALIAKIAKEKGLVFLPLNRAMTEAIERKANPHESDFIGGDQEQMYLAIFYHYIFRQSWDEIADNFGFLYLTDNVHLNGRGGRMVADLIAGFLSGH